MVFRNGLWIMDHSLEAIYLPGCQNWERIPTQLSGASVSNSLHARAEREGRAVNLGLGCKAKTLSF